MVKGIGVFEIESSGAGGEIPLVTFLTCYLTN